MFDAFPKLTKQAAKTFSQAWTACAIVMVGGDFSVFSIDHAGVAAATGAYATFGLLLAIYLKPNSSKWFIAWVTGVVTMFADRLVHPSHYEGNMSEAFYTGLLAFFLCMVFDFLRLDDD